MNKKRKNDETNPLRHSGIDAHKRLGTKLMNPLHSLNMDVLQWEQNFLPEHLWLAALITGYEWRHWYPLYNDLLDEIDKVWAGKTVALGYLTDFGEVPSELRSPFLSEHRELVLEAFHKPIGDIISLYPDCPANWLVLHEELESTDMVATLEKLNALILTLMKAKDLIAGHIRAVPLGRLFKHRKIHLFEGLSVVDKLPRYPVGCTEDEQYEVQQFARSTLNMHYGSSDLYRKKEWPKHFWRHNRLLVPCSPLTVGRGHTESPTQEEADRVFDTLERNSKNAAAYMDQLASSVNIDLYSPEKDEILLGLISRSTRMYRMIAESPQLWAKDIGGIVLRCLADTAITFSYLAKKGTDKDFIDFKKYGEGKEKLLMLHLQENYPGKRSLEGSSAEDLAEELGGGFSPELIDIELGNWTKKSSRTLAIEAEMVDFYRLVYDPASSDVHGTWVSIKSSNLFRCGQPLHRFHRLPSCNEPALYINIVIAAQNLYQSCIDVATKVLHYPTPETALEDIPYKTPSES